MNVSITSIAQRHLYPLQANVIIYLWKNLIIFSHFNIISPFLIFSIHLHPTFLAKTYPLYFHHYIWQILTQTQTQTDPDPLPPNYSK